MEPSTTKLNLQLTSAQTHADDTINLFNDMQWKHETIMGNYAFKRNQGLISVTHYKAALKIAKHLFSQYEDQLPPPDSLVPILVISYLNLADFWAQQGKNNQQKNCLIHAFDYLICKLNNLKSADHLHNHICSGIDKIYPELMLCLQDCQRLDILEEKKAMLASLQRGRII
ncbi:MAG: hypothetical protein COA90_01980 [Gammaproteobacteria bacterium]|nr:MAG: hypothetical protein COA90_01980 [Gammaproteobacteria bacterium]